MKIFFASALALALGIVGLLIAVAIINVINMPVGYFTPGPYGDECVAFFIDGEVDEGVCENPPRRYVREWLAPGAGPATVRRIYKEG